MAQVPELLLPEPDERGLAELGSDTDDDGTVNSGNSILVTALEQASDDVRSYTLRGGIYTDADLDALQTAGDGTLKGLVCDLAAEICVARRFGQLPEAVKRRADMARTTLADLRSGARVFGDFAESRVGASNPSISIISQTRRPNFRMTTDSEFFPPRLTERQ